MTYHDTEKTALATMFVSADREMLDFLEERDFTDPLHRLLLGEAKAMVAAGNPWFDILAWKRWWERAEVKARAKKAKEPEALALSLDLMRTGFSNPSNRDYYLRCLRIDRLSRAVGSLASTLAKRNKEAPQDPAANLLWAKRSIDHLIERIPEEKGSPANAAG